MAIRAIVICLALLTCTASAQWSQFTPQRGGGGNDPSQQQTSETQTTERSPSGGSSGEPSESWHSWPFNNPATESETQEAGEQWPGATSEQTYNSGIPGFQPGGTDEEDTENMEPASQDAQPGTPFDPSQFLNNGGLTGDPTATEEEVVTPAEPQPGAGSVEEEPLLPDVDPFEEQQDQEQVPGGGGDTDVVAGFPPLEPSNFSTFNFPPAVTATSPPGMPAPPPYESMPLVDEEMGEQAFGLEMPSVCGLSDYLRKSTECTSGERTITFERRRNCSDPFPVPPPHKEPCDCTPDDFTLTYRAHDNKCFASFVPQNCSMQQQQPEFEVDTIYCEIGVEPCRLEHLKAIYSPCRSVSNPESGEVVKGDMSVEVIYYFDSDCNPYAKDSVRLPASSFIPCDLKCGAGSYLDRDKCRRCPAGTYSMGGALRYTSFIKSDLGRFEKSCLFRNSSGSFECPSWYVDDGALEVGAYDFPNDFMPDECKAHENYNCHNNLRSLLALEVDLVRDGSVTFNFTVSSEMGHDGLSFFIDSETDPVMALESYQFAPRRVSFNLTAGHHRLMWLYSKNARWTKGDDIATITFLEVDGIEYNDRFCIPCPGGTFSKEGSSQCESCPVNHVSSDMATECTPCAESEYALVQPRIMCAPRPACVVQKDSSFQYSPCRATDKKRQKSWEWREPRICQPSADEPLPDPVAEDCPPCPDGQEALVDLNGDTVHCQMCPKGTARSRSDDDLSAAVTENQCHQCQTGQVPVQVLTLEHFHMEHGRLPDRFRTGCHGDCGTFGWRAVNGHLDSGSGHGITATIWLALDISVMTEGIVSFNFSADIRPGDPGRAFFFFIDNDLVDYVEQQREEWDGTGQAPAGASEDEISTSGPWTLKAGNHTLLWTWEKLNDQKAGKRATRDSLEIYDIRIEGAASGGADRCDEIPAGNKISEDGFFYVPCPPGTSSTGGAFGCQPCAADTFSNDIGSFECQPCRPGTSSMPGSSDCMVGLVSNPETFCTFKLTQAAVNESETSALPPMSDAADVDMDPERFKERVKEIEAEAGREIVYDLKPLAVAAEGHMVGPIFNDPWVLNKTRQAQYFVSVCHRDPWGDACVDLDGKTLNTYACKVDPPEEIEGPRRPGHNLGRSVGIRALSDSQPLLQRRGLVMEMRGDRCPSSDLPHKLDIYLMCDPGAGVGKPEAWTTAGRSAAFNPAASLAEWISREGEIIPVQRDECSAEMVWYSAHACPLCHTADYEMVSVWGCTDNKHTVFKLKTGRLCQPNPMLQIPPDLDCRPCNAIDVHREEGQCLDSSGQRNVTFTWGPGGGRDCNPDLPGSASLPDSIAAGPCAQSVRVVPADKLSVGYIVGFVLVGALFLTFSVLWLMAYLRHRKLQQLYAQMLESEAQMEAQLEELENEGAKMLGEGATSDSMHV